MYGEINPYGDFFRCLESACSYMIVVLSILATQDQQYTTDLEMCSASQNRILLPELSQQTTNSLTKDIACRNTDRCKFERWEIGKSESRTHCPTHPKVIRVVSRARGSAVSNNRYIIPNNRSVRFQGEPPRIWCSRTSSTSECLDARHVVLCVKMSRATLDAYPALRRTLRSLSFIALMTMSSIFSSLPPLNPDV